MPLRDHLKPTLESLIMVPLEDLASLKIYPQSVDNVFLSIEKNQWQQLGKVMLGQRAQQEASLPGLAH